MLHRLILKVTKLQLPPPKRLGTVIKNHFGGLSCPPPMSNRVKTVDISLDNTLQTLCKLLLGMLHKVRILATHKLPKPGL